MPHISGDGLPAAPEHRGHWRHFLHSTQNVRFWARRSKFCHPKKTSHGNALLLLHSQIIFISGGKWRQQRKKVIEPTLQKFPIVHSFQRAKAPTLHFMPWSSSIAIPQLLGRIFPPSLSWGQCYEYRLQHSKSRQAAATDGIWLGECLVMRTSAFAIWFIAWMKVASFQAGMQTHSTLDCSLINSFI